MHRSVLLAPATVTCVVMGALTLVAAGQPGTAPLEERARALMRQAPLVDGHNDIPWAVRDHAGYDFDKLDLRQPQPELQTDIPRLREGLVGAQFWSVYVPASMQGDKAVTATLEQVAAVHEMTRRYPDTFELARTAADVERIFKAGRIASMMGMEGGQSINSSLGALRMFRQLGVGYMTLTHGSNVPWADSATDTPRAGGLSAFGEEVVREMNRLGMLVDLSHVSPDTMKDALRVTEAPVIFSHSNARALCDVDRNVPDDVLRMLPSNGGVLMVTFVPSFTVPEAGGWTRQFNEELRRVREANPNAPPAETRKAIQQWVKAHPEPPATLAQVVDHIDYVRKVAGIDHIGIGSDFDGIDKGPAGLEDVSKYPALAVELLKRGYSDGDVQKILGLNVLRVMRQAESVAAKLQASRPPSVKTMEQLDGHGSTGRQE